MRLRVFAALLLFSSAAAAMDRLPTGQRLDAAGRLIRVGNMPLAMLPTPDLTCVVVSQSGWLHQGLQVVDLESGKILQTIDKKSTFFGLWYSNLHFYASGGQDNVVYVFRWEPEQRLVEEDPIPVQYPAGLSVSNDRKMLYVAEQFANDVAVVDLASRKVIQRIATDHYPMDVIARGNRVYVSAWGGHTVSIFRRQANGRLSLLRKLNVGRHPSKMFLSDTKLYVTLASVDRIAEINTKTRAIRYFDDRSPAGVREGSTPNALAVADGKLYVAEADNNAVGVFDISSRKLLGRIPTDWYPVALLALGDRLVVLNGKGAESHPNPNGPREYRIGKDPNFDLALVDGTLRVLPLPVGHLAPLTERVARANGWNEEVATAAYPPFKHVIYIIKENRTYDQVFGDIPEGDGDRSLVFFGNEITPNHHALAARFGLFDHFFVNAEVSSQGHVWSNGAYVTDYTEKTVHSVYAEKRPDIEDEGEVDEPVAGYLWDSAVKKGITLRIYGEWTVPDPQSKGHYRAMKKAADAYLNRDYPPFDMWVSDQRRADVWLAEFAKYVESGNLPALEIVHLPNDHAAGGKAGLCTPKACVADNDWALARIVEAVSSSPFWRDTVFFVLEDDAQYGSDHIDAHRSLLLVISAYNRSGVFHRFTNTTDVIRAIEDILGLTRFSQFDAYGRPLADVFGQTADLTPYRAMKPAVNLDEKNPATGNAAKKSANFDLSRPDAVNDLIYNGVIWDMLKGVDSPSH